MKRGGAEESLLELVARANSIISDISHLSNEVPSLFREAKGPGSELIFDFSYLKSPDSYDALIERNESLMDLDARLKEEFLEVLTKFYQCFEGIERYGSDLIQFITDLDEGKFIQQTLESLMQTSDGKQLLGEGVYLQGVILLLLDQKLPGIVRERLLVSYYRYSGQSGSNSNMDTVCQLLRSTGYEEGGKRPSSYPENYFARVSIQKHIIKQLVAMLRSEDLYNMLPFYPQTQERSTALSGQAGMLVILLYFDPNLLKQETAVMREMVDKYFSDNWVVSLYLGITIWLPEAWESYKAAKSAISNTTSNNDVKMQAQKHGQSLKSLIPRLEDLLMEGVVTKDILLEDPIKLINVLRESNVCLKWLFLHTAQLSPSVANHKRTRILYETCCKESGMGSKDLFNLLLLTARLEQLIRELYQQVLDQRTQTWDKLKEDSKTRLEELADVFGGKQKLSRIEPNKKLQKWLLLRADQICKLDVEDTQVSARLAVQLIQALQEARSFHHLGSNLQVIQYLSETEKNLLQMVQLVSAKDDALVKVQILSDFSFGWELVKNFSSLMQSEIQRSPAIVSDIRCIFIKLSGAMEGSMIRLCEAESGDMVKVSQHYSKTLVTFIRNILQVIPDTMFVLLDQIIALQAQLKQVPTRLEKEKLKEISMMDNRFEIARLTHQVSVLSRGIMALGKTLVGVVQVDPKKLLEEGMRRELVRRVSTLLHTNFIFNPKSKDRYGELVERVANTKKVMESFRQSFEYIQDYIGIPSLSLWQEEISRLINFAVEREAAMFLRGHPQQYSQYQNSDIRIPEYSSVQDDPSRNFMGRIANKLLEVTHSSGAVYVQQDQSWFLNKPPHSPIVGHGLISELCLGIGVTGMTGLSRLLGLMAITKVQKLLELIQKETEDAENSKMLNNLRDTLDGYSDVVQNPGKVYTLYTNKLNRTIQALNQHLNLIGQISILRQMISEHLSGSVMFQAKLLKSTVWSLQSALLTNTAVAEEVLTSEDGCVLLSELTVLAQWLGLDRPEDQTYVPSPLPAENLELLLGLTVLHAVQRSQLSVSTGFLLSKKQGELDGRILAEGMKVLLNHYNEQLMLNIASMVGQAETAYRLSGDEVQANCINAFITIFTKTSN